MSDNKSRKEAIAKKLLALINDAASTEGEREAAERRLSDILEKYDLDLDSLTPEKEDELIFKSYKYKTPYERTLIIQINAMLSDGKYGLFYDYTDQWKRSRCMLRLKAPLVYHVEFETAYEIYKELYYNEIRLFEAAFLHKHNLFPQTPHDDAEDVDSGFSLEDIARMSMMANSMKDHQLHKLLTSGNPQLESSTT